MPTDNSDDSPRDPLPERRTSPSGGGAPELLRVEDLAFQDDLTGLPNRRFVNRLLTDEWALFVARHAGVSILLIDLDGFKLVNDNYGHAAGDLVLKTVALLLRQSFRDGDLVVRYGGDEFLVVLKDAGEEATKALAGRARAAIEAHAFLVAEGGERIAVPLSFSMGVAIHPADGETGKAIVEAADRRLYEEKRRRSHPRPARQAPLATGARAGWALLALLAVAGFGYLLWRPTPVVAARRSVAVLGFKNLSGRPERAWLSTAFAEMLGMELAAGERIRTVPGESVARMKIELSLPDSDSFTPETLARIRQNLGADYVVLGSYLALDAAIRLDLRVQDAAAGETVALVSETGTEDLLLDLVDRAGARLRTELGLAGLSATEAEGLKAALPERAETARLFAEGLGHLRAFDALAARALFEQAVAREPASPTAHAALGDAWAALGHDTRAREEARKAFELSGGLSREERLAAEARYRGLTYEWERAVASYRALASFFPDNLEYLLRLAGAESSAGRGRAALATLDGARRLAPPAAEDPRIDLAEASVAESIGDFALERDAARRAASKGEAQGARLLVARARLLEAWSLLQLGEGPKAIEACHAARRIFTEAGDRGGAAWALHRTGIVLWRGGKLLEAKKAHEESLPTFREIGDERGTSRALNGVALVLNEQGDLAGAREFYEASRRISQGLGDRQRVGVSLNNIAEAALLQGDLAEARRLCDEALVLCREIGDRYLPSFVLRHLAEVHMAEADLPAARRRYEETLRASLEAGRKANAAYAMAGLGDVLWAEGDLAGARQKHTEALALREELKERLTATDSRLALAALAIDEGQPGQGEAEALRAALVFERERASARAASAQSVLAAALLAQGRLPEARAASLRARALAAKSQDVFVRLAVATITARVGAKGVDVAGAVTELAAVAAESKRRGLVTVELLARLAQGEAELSAGSAQGAARLQAVSREAKARGLHLVARKAAAASGSVSPGAFGTAAPPG